MDPKAAELRESLRRLFRRLGFMERDEARCCSMSVSRCQVLVEVGRTENLSLVDLSARMGLEKSTVSRLVDALVEEGLAERRESPLDRRYLSIVLTAEGKELCGQVESRMDAYVASAWDRVPVDLRDKVLESLRILEGVFGKDCCERREQG